MKTMYSHHTLVDSWPAKWFKPHELASRGNGSLLVDWDALARLDALRELIGRPMIINSAYRDPLYNARVGGAARSQHKQGNAFDISLRGHDKWALYAAAKRVGFTGFGFYNTFLHVDTGRKRSWGKW